MGRGVARAAGVAGPLVRVVLPLVLVAGCAAPTASLRDTPAPPGDPRPPARAFTVTVERVVDGDTFIALRAGKRLRVRLIGVDTPESVRPGWPVECWGPESSALLQRLLPAGSRASAAYQAGGRQDRYDRELWDVWLADGRFLQAVLVRRGAAIAEAYPPQTAYADLLEALEQQAREQRRGQFGSCRP